MSDGDEFAPVTPGEILNEEFLTAYGLSQNQLAKAIVDEATGAGDRAQKSAEARPSKRPPRPSKKK